MKKKKDSAVAGHVTRGNENNPKKGFRPNEKTTLGGAHNSGVTSDDPHEKRMIEKQATLYNKQPKAPQGRSKSKK